MQTTEAILVNPLDLPVEWRSPSPLHEVTDPEHAAEIAESMRAAGWNGAPVVADYELRCAGQDRAYTGVHRLAAWADARDEYGVPVPCVYIEDIAAVTGVNWSQLMSDADGDPYEAARQFCAAIPAAVCEAYGLDIH